MLEWFVNSARALARAPLAITAVALMSLLTGCTQSADAPDCQGHCDPNQSDLPAIPAPATEAAGTRSFQMALWDNAESIDADLAFFTEGQPQPAVRSILRVGSWWNQYSESNSTFGQKLAGHQYDWSRIAAVLIDEPYWYNTGARDRTNPCGNSADPRNQQIARTAAQLADAAAVISDLSPSTRFWVNFSVPEMQWASDSACPIAINQPYIDVVSLDSYWGTFENVARPYYDWLSDNRATPYQQFALIPGTFFRSDIDDPYLQASYLQGYFDYARAANRRCDLPVGRVGVTGNWDGCPIWLVLGWLASSPQLSDGQVWRGVLDPLSSVIATEWKAQLAHPKLDPILGLVESFDASTRTFTGWAISRNSTGAPLHIEVWVGDELYGETIAAHHRADVGDLYGRYEAGFSFAIPDEYVDGRCYSTRIYAVSQTGEPRNRTMLPSATQSSICLTSPT